MKTPISQRLISFARYLGRTLAYYLGMIHEEETVFARIYYSFDHGTWRTRNTRQLRREHRCKQ